MEGLGALVALAVARVATVLTESGKNEAEAARGKLVRLSRGRRTSVRPPAGPMVGFSEYGWGAANVLSGGGVHDRDHHAGVFQCQCH